MSRPSVPVRPVTHPATQEAFARAAERWNALRSEHRRHADDLWAGTMAREFSDFEFDLLKLHGFISPNDFRLFSLMRGNS